MHFLGTGSLYTVVTNRDSLLHGQRRWQSSPRCGVLRPGGALLLTENGRAPDQWAAHWQEWLTPAWRPLAGGCHSNCPIAERAQDTGIRLTAPRTGCVPGLRPFTFMFEGCATPR